VLPHCYGCDIAAAVAERVSARRLPHLTVRLVDLSASGSSRPPAVFAVPTYLLDGRVISLGNPDEDWLLAHLARTGAGPAEGVDDGTIARTPAQTCRAHA
jgi:hypothetical protein